MDQQADLNKQSLHSQGEKIMGKIRQNNKEPRKPSTLTPKEKKAAKQARKHASDVVPLIPPR
jgi:hypothetical protein